MVNMLPMAKSSDRKNQTRQRILAAARSVFASHGLSGARVDAVAKTAGCTKGLVLHYFGSKQGLWEAVLQYYLGMGESSEFLAASSTPDRAGIEHFMGRTFRFFQTHPDFNALANRAATQPGVVVPEAMFALLRKTQSSFQRAQKNGVLNDRIAADQAQLMVFLLISGWFSFREIFAHATAKNTADEANDEEFFQAMLELFSAGLFNAEVSPTPTVSQPSGVNHSTSGGC